MRAENYAGMAFAIGASDLSHEAKTQNIIGLLSQARVDEQLNTMRAEGQRFTNLGEATERARRRKKVESKTIEPRLLNG